MHKAKVIWTLLKMKISQLSPFSVIQLMLVPYSMLPPKHVYAPYLFCRCFGDPHLQSNLILPDLLLQLLAELFSLLSETLHLKVALEIAYFPYQA